MASNQDIINTEELQRRYGNKSIELVKEERPEDIEKDLQQLNLDTEPETPEPEFKFWKTQPVPQSSEEEPVGHAPIDAIISVDEVRSTPFDLPDELSWCEIDANDDDEVREVYDLLYQHYVGDGDDDFGFRFNYSIDFIKYILLAPGYHKNWHVGVRNASSGKLFGFVCGVPSNMKVYNNAMPMAEINFLCIHTDLRSQRLTPLLIKEITRRINLNDVWQAVYTAGVYLPTPVSTCNYCHRPLNPKKCIEAKFTMLPPNTTMTNVIKKYRLPDEPKLANFQPIQPKHIPSVTTLLRQYLEKFDLRAEMNEEEVAHWFLTRPGVVYTYVIENPETQLATDFCSFYIVPATLYGNSMPSSLSIGYSYYNVATTVPLADLMQDTLVMAKKENVDAFNCLNIMDNGEFIEPLKFDVSPAELMYYLFNWKCPRMSKDKIGLVLQ